MYLVASMALQRLGMPRELVVSMFTSIQSMKHIIWTAFGDSVSYINCADLDKPYQGILQGNSTRPIIWAAFSTLVVDVLYDKDCRVRITSAISKQSNKFVGSLFVDNIDLASGKLNRAEVDTDQVNQNLQKAIEW